MPTHVTDSVSDQPDRATSEPPVESESTHLRPLRVLIVDDGDAMPGVLQQLADGIQSGRYVVDRAATLADGFGAIVGGEHDVCVVDHHIGARTGFDLLARVTAEGLHVPIVFVTDSGDHGTGVTAVGAGASCYIVKDSIGSEHLDQCLRQAVEERRTLSRLTNAGIAVDGGTPTKTQIFAHIAERLGEPAAAILDTARTTLDRELPAHVAEALVAIEDEVATLLTLAHDLNDLSMLESGRLHFDSAPFSLRGLVSSVKRIAGPSSTSRGVEIIDDVSAEVPDSVIGDPGRLRLVVVRFVDNVIERGASDRVLLKVDVEERASETVTLRFEIEATGPGSTASETPAVGGDVAGVDDDPLALHNHGLLGIPVALETVSRMGGHVTVEDETDQPARIQFTIRLGISEDEEQPRPAADSQSPLERPILIIAEALDDRRSIVKTLSESSLPYVVASSADEWIATRQFNGDKAIEPALAVIASTQDSFTACDRFRELAASVPVIAIAPFGQRGDAARCREHGVRGYLAKPMDPGDLVDVVKATRALTESGDTSTFVTRHWLRDGRRSLHVLVVDDSPTSLFLMTRMLEQRGHSTTSACDGSEAIEAFQRDTFDIVLMDIMMPGIDGLEATRLIRSMDAGSTQRPQIIGVSAFADEENQTRGHDAGMDAMLEKPLRPDDLFALIEQQTPAESTHPA